ncbi:MAG TPA: hypothetical protein VLT86_09565 [Vicinamibacterales bacterium]|nr:hypothetical protein [Vicinamibacterales bacterium]
MTGLPPEGATDERLRQLLQAEDRLQRLVQSARDRAAAQIAEAQDERERRLASARDAIARTDAEQASADHAAHVDALAAIDARHRAALRVITELPDTRVDDLARLALLRAIETGGDLP